MHYKTVCLSWGSKPYLALRTSCKQQTLLIVNACTRPPWQRSFLASGFLEFQFQNASGRGFARATQEGAVLGMLAPTVPSWDRMAINAENNSTVDTYVFKSKLLSWKTYSFIPSRSWKQEDGGTLMQNIKALPDGFKTYIFQTNSSTMIWTYSSALFSGKYGSLWRAAGREAPHVPTSAKGVDGMDLYLPLLVCIRCSTEVHRKGRKGWRLYVF